MKAMIAAGALALGLAAGGAAAAQSAEPEAQRDLTCMAVFLTIADSADPEMQQAGTVGALFFYGRLQGREPNVSWFDRLGDFADSVSMEELMSHGPECGGVVEQVGQDMLAYVEEYGPAE